jgi:hypothetical protein
MRKERKNINNLEGKIEKVRIPDENIKEWFEVLSEGGDMSTEEINSILSHLNETYRNQMALTNKEVRNAMIKDFIQQAEIYLLQKYTAFVNHKYRTDFENFIASVVNENLNLKKNFDEKEIMEKIQEEIDRQIQGIKGKQ